MHALASPLARPNSPRGAWCIWPPELGGLFPQWEESRTPLRASDVPALVGFLWCNGIEPDTIMGL